MASSGTGSVQDLGESRAQALQALLNSISAEGASIRNGDKLNPEQVRKISDKLGEILGEDALITNESSQKRNENGELVNEEGLPIIDIVEPLSASEQTSASDPTQLFDDPDVLPLWTLSPAEKARRRAERERILDLFEEEERIQQERDEVAERERWLTDLERRKEAAKAEMEALKKAREMQKKMGKALLRNMSEAKEREEKERSLMEQAEEKAREEKNRLKPKKSVTFADDTTSPEGKSPKFDWGDVTPARLQRKGKNTLMTKAQIDSQPMKMDIVERMPSGSRPPQSPPLQISQDGDSDDESIPGSPVPADSDEGEVILSDHSEESDHHAPPHSDSDQSDVGECDDELVVWDDDNHDFARHQREIALAYYEKRAAIGAEALGAMRGHSHDEHGNEWDQPDVPLEATLSSAPPKPPISRFKATRVPSSSTLASHSLGSSVLPSSQTSSLKSAVRVGKLEDGKLIGDDGDSEDEMDGVPKEVLELLKNGDIVNVGPQSSSNNRAGVSGAVVSELSPTSEAGSSSHRRSPNVEEPVRSTRPKPSKFKTAMSKSRGQQDAPSPSASDFSTPPSTVERSSPKMASRSGTPIAIPTSASQPPRRSAVQRQLDKSISFATPAQHAQMAMVVDSLSFPPSAIPSGLVTASTSAPPTPLVIESPSFSHPQPTSQAGDFMRLQSIVLDSPSYQPSAAAIVTSPPFPAPAQSSNNAAVNPAVAERTGVVMSAEVEESTSRRGTLAGGREKKVSRFLAERM